MTGVSVPWVPGNGHHSCQNVFRAVDNAGNVSTWTAEQHIHMDTEAPRVTNSWYGGVANGGVSLYIQVSDNIGVARVQAPTSTGKGGYNNWHWYEAVWDAGANAWRADIKGSDYGHYDTDFYTHIYPYDHAGNVVCQPKDDAKAYIPTPNTAPVVEEVNYSSKTTNSITVTARAVDAQNDELTYTMYVSTDNVNWIQKATSSSVASGTTVTLTANGLAQYTYYYVKVRATETYSRTLIWRERT